MNRYRRRQGRPGFAGLLGILLLPLLLGGCVFFRSNETHYYLFEYDTPETERTDSSDPASQSQPLIRGSLIVEEPVVSPIYERRQIVQRTQGPQLTFLSNDLWVVNPSSGVQRLLLDRLREARLFGSVEPARRDLPGDYRLTSSVDRLELDIREESARARVSLGLLLRRTSSGEIVLTGGGSRSRELSEPTPYRFAVAVNEILREEIEAFILAVEEWR